MMTSFRKTAFLAASFCFVAGGAIAAPNSDGPSDCVGIKIATGPNAKGYSNLFADLKKVCGETVPICEVNTDGGLDNLTLLSTKGAEAGFAAVDTYNSMKVGDENIAALQAIMPLNHNYLHVVVKSSGFDIIGEKKFGGFVKGDTQHIVINKFSELRNRPVAVVGSARHLARKLNEMIPGFGMDVVDVADDKEALDQVQKGIVAAALTMSSWPSGPIKRLNQDSGLTLAIFDVPITAEPFKLRNVTYKGIAAYNIPALAVPNVFFTRPFTGARAQKIADLQQCILQNLSELKEGEYEPAWNEIKSVTETYKIPAFALPKEDPAVIAPPREVLSDLDKPSKEEAAPTEVKQPTKAAKTKKTK